jgi:hypothetical protein
MSIIIFLLICSMPALWIGSGIWAFGDAKRRNKPPVLVVLLVMFAVWPFGLIAWLVFRPDLQPFLPPKKFNLLDYREQ